MRISDWSSDVCSSDRRSGVSAGRPGRSVGTRISRSRRQPRKNSNSAWKSKKTTLSHYFVEAGEDRGPSPPQRGEAAVDHARRLAELVGGVGEEAEVGGGELAGELGEIGRAAWRESVGQSV